MKNIIIADLLDANHILYFQKVLDGFGHVSARHDQDPGRFWLSRSLAPNLVTAEDILEFDLDAKPVRETSHHLYVERFIHSEIYRSRPDVKAIVHSHSPSIIPFGVTKVALQPIYHMSGFLGTGVPVFEIRDFATSSDLLIRTPALGAGLARTLGDNPVVLMRGHGSVVVGFSLQQAVYRAVYLDLNARLQSEAMHMGEINFLTAEEAVLAAEANDRVLSRPWDLWRKDLAKAEGGT